MTPMHRIETTPAPEIGGALVPLVVLGLIMLAGLAYCSFYIARALLCWFMDSWRDP
jgi:hypothetical protein